MKILLLLAMCGFFALNGCSIAAMSIAGTAANDVDKILKADYAHYIISMQESGVGNNVLPFKEWAETEPKVFSDYGNYYDACLKYPEKNIGGPLGFKEWSKIQPYPEAKTGKY
jgi:hypothetical protein